MGILGASQKYLTTWLVEYTDEFFVLLYYDIGGTAKSTAKEVFDHGRSLVLYGGRGIGKTTLMQGILWHGLKNHGNTGKKFLPVNVVITGANTVTTMSDLEDKFYQSVLEGIYFTLHVESKYKKNKPHVRKNNSMAGGRSNHCSWNGLSLGGPSSRNSTKRS